MKTCKYLEESLNFSDALQQIKKERSVNSPTEPVGKAVSSQNVSSRYSVQNGVGAAKYTKRTNLNLKQLLEQYIENSKNEYVLTLGIGGVQNRKHQVFDVWISQLRGKQADQLDVLRKNSQNETIQRSTRNIKQEKTMFKSRDQNRNKICLSKLPNVQPSSRQQKTTRQIDSEIIQGQLIKQPQCQKHIKVILRPQIEVRDDEVVKVLQELSIHEEEGINKQRLIQKVSQEINQSQKQNMGPTHNKQLKQVKGLEFSKRKRYLGSKRKRKLQI